MRIAATQEVQWSLFLLQHAQRFNVVSAPLADVDKSERVREEDLGRKGEGESEPEKERVSEKGLLLRQAACPWDR